MVRRAMSLSMLWELRMSDLHPLLNAHPHLQHDLCADVIEVPALEKAHLRCTMS
jgi:type II secretory pathway predicted ATPase ExeA